MEATTIPCEQTLGESLINVQSYMAAEMATMRADIEQLNSVVGDLPVQAKKEMAKGTHSGRASQNHASSNNICTLIAFNIISSCLYSSKIIFSPPRELPTGCSFLKSNLMSYLVIGLLKIQERRFDVDYWWRGSKKGSSKHSISPNYPRSKYRHIVLPSRSGQEISTPT